MPCISRENGAISSYEFGQVSFVRFELSRSAVQSHLDSNKSVE